MRQAATILGASKVATLQFPLPRKESARLDVAIATIEATLGSDLFALLVQQGGALDVVRCAELVERELVLIAEGQ